MIFDLQHTKSALASIYVSSLTGHDNELYANQILAVGDQMNRTTNVKADMTNWETFLPVWEHLSLDIMKNHLQILVGEEVMIGANFICYAMWGASYRKGDYTVFHHHFPAALSFIYYVKADEDSAPLVFIDIDYELHPKENDLIIFPSYLKHGVPTQMTDANRICISGNIGATPT